jgi:hypothetical protein
MFNIKDLKFDGVYLPALVRLVTGCTPVTGPGPARSGPVQSSPVQSSQCSIFKCTAVFGRPGPV